VIPRKQFYIKLFFSNTVILVSCPTSSTKNAPDSLTVAVPCKPLSAQNRARQQAEANCPTSFRDTTLVLLC